MCASRLNPYVLATGIAKQTADYLFHCLHSDMCLHLLDRSYRYRFSLDFLCRKVNFEWAHT